MTWRCYCTCAMCVDLLMFLSSCSRVRLYWAPMSFPLFCSELSGLGNEGVEQEKTVDIHRLIHRACFSHRAIYQLRSKNDHKVCLSSPQDPQEKQGGERKFTNMKGTRHLTIVIKIGSSSIVDETTHQPILSILSLIVETAIKLRRDGHRVVIVSSGAIAVGLQRMNIPKKPKHLPQIQVCHILVLMLLFAFSGYLFQLQFHQCLLSREI